MDTDWERIPEMACPDCGAVPIKVVESRCGACQQSLEGPFRERLATLQAEVNAMSTTPEG